MSGYLVSKAEMDNESLSSVSGSKILLADQKTLNDYYAFFSGKEVDMLPYVYAEPSDAYNALVHTPEYYLFKDEVNTITHNQDALRKYLGGVTDIVEIGPGCDYAVENKTVHILNCAADLERYHAIDYSENYLKEACLSVSKRKPGIEVVGVEADLMNGKIDLGKIPNGKKCILFLGSTLGNFTEAQQKHAICQVARMTNPGDLLILGVDTNIDEKTVLKAYDYSDKCSYNFMVSILKHFSKISPQFENYLKFFDIKSEWDEFQNLVRIFLRVNQDVILKINKFKSLSIKKNDILKIGVSRKFRIQDIKRLLKNKFDILEDISYSSKMKIFICRNIKNLYVSDL